MAIGQVEIQYPVAGIDKRMSYQRQPPYTCVSAQNVRANNAADGRMGGGQRPGVVKAYALAHANTAYSGTVTGVPTYSSSTTYSTVTLASGTLNSDSLGAYFKFAASGNVYRVRLRNSTTVIQVQGDASGETSGDSWSLSAGEQINMLATLTPVPTDEDVGGVATEQYPQTYRDKFNVVNASYALNSEWVVLASPGTAPEIHNTDLERAVNQDAATVGVSRTQITDNDSTEPFFIELKGYIPPRNSKNTYQGIRGKRWTIYLRLDNTTPVAGDDGIHVHLNAPAAGTSGKVTTLNNFTLEVTEKDGASTVYTRTVNVPFEISEQPLLRVTSSDWDSGGQAIDVSVDGETLVSFTSANNAGTRQRFGFGLSGVAGTEDDDSGDGQWPSVLTHVSRFLLSYTAIRSTATSDDAHVGATQNRSIIVSGAGGFVYRENNSGEMELADTFDSADPRLSEDKLILAQENRGKLYIADFDNPLIYGAGTITAGVDDTLTDAQVTDWTQFGIDVGNSVVVVDNVAGAAVAGVYPVTAVAVGGVVIGSYGAGGTGNVSYRVTTAPKIYDPQAAAGDRVYNWFASTGNGTVPVGCPIITLYRDRIVLAGPNHLWYMARQGDPLDWQYSDPDTDPQRAVAATNTRAGVIADVITAAMAWSDDYMIFANRNKLWLLRGDPAAWGSINNISNDCGIIDRAAWCRTDANELVFIGPGGLYSLMTSGDAASLTPISSSRIPRELIGINRDVTTAVLQYDVEERGVHIFLSDTTYTTSRHWYVDWETKGFWPVTMQPYQRILAACQHRPLAGDNVSVMVGCRDGFIRRFERMATHDDGETIDSNVWIGPIRAGGADTIHGLVTEIVGVLSQTSGNVTWSLHGGNTPEEASNATEFASGTWKGGLSYTDRPRMRCSAFFLKVSGAGSGWSMERVNATVKRAGKVRVA